VARARRAVQDGSMMPTEMPVLAAPPVILREFRDADAALVQSVADDPLIPLITTVPVTGDEADARAFIARQRDRLAAGAGYSFAIADAATGAAVGQIGLWLNDLPHGRADLGYWVAPAFRGHGYVTAALIAVSRWGLSLGGMDRLQLNVEPWNEGSWRAAERAGFTREGLLRSWQRVGPHRRDMYMYSLLPADLPDAP
jgi:ribosomal-protein-alanine N-acetyltransferase